MSRRTWMQVASTCLEVIKGDLSDLDADAIVNAAGACFMPGSGVAGAIGRRSASSMQEEGMEGREGEAGEEEKLAEATLGALALAEAHGLRSIGFPAISTGIPGLPVDHCAEIMLGTIIAFLAPGAWLERVVICLQGEESFDCFARELEAQRAEDA